MASPQLALVATTPTTEPTGGTVVQPPLQLYGSQLYVAVSGLKETYESAFLNPSNEAQLRRNAAMDAHPTMKPCVLNISEICSVVSLRDVAQAALMQALRGWTSAAAVPRHLLE